MTTEAPNRGRLTLGESMVLIAGVAASLWMVRIGLHTFDPKSWHHWLCEADCMLWGISIVGPILLVRERVGRRTPWSAGEWLWFVQGIAGWLFGPPYAIITIRSRGSYIFDDLPVVLAFFWTTPLIGLVAALALLAGGRFRRRRPRRRASWKGRLGLVLGLMWAGIGVFMLVYISGRVLSKFQ